LMARMRPGTPVLGMSRRIELPGSVNGAVGAVTGLASPRGFEDMLRAHGVDLKLCARFPDHHHYDAGDVATIRRIAGAYGVDTLVVTEKDFVKLRHLELAEAPELHVARLHVGFEDGHAIEEMLKPRRRAAASA